MSNTFRKPVIIIAEAGVNHNGDFEKAKELIRVAAEAGADFVKFQTFKAEKLVTKSAKKAQYQSQNMADTEDGQFSMLKKLEMPEAWHAALKEFAAENGISFLSTGFDEASIDFLDNLGISIFKVPSGEITNKPYLQHIARKKKPVVLSTGMADLKEVEEAVSLLVAEGVDKKELTVLHCNTEYPTPMKDVNLHAMKSIEQALGVSVGYSDHTAGIEVPIAAVALGACLIEKHFTLDRNLPGPDHKASLEPDELKQMIKAIRNIEMAISGDGVKAPSESEKPNMLVARKSIHAAKRIEKGEVLTREHLAMKRPGNGISPMKMDEVIGTKAKENLEEDQQLQWEHLER